MSSETPFGIPDFVGLYGPDALQPWERFLVHFELGEGFSLLVLLLPGPVGDRVCEEELVLRLRGRSRELAVLRFGHPNDVRGLSDRLLRLETPARVGGVWVGSFPSEILFDLERWQAAWRQGLALLNQYRNLLRRRFKVPLVFAGAPWLQEVMREAAPDIWSVRAAVVRIIPGPVDRARGEQMATALESEVGPSREAATDPDYALEVAERLRNREGQEAGRLDLLLRAAWGFNEQARLEAAEGAFREAVALCRKLMQQAPDQFKPKLMEGLNGLAIALRKSAKVGEAAIAGREALAVARELARRQAEIYQTYEAGALNDLGNVQLDLNALEEARASFEEAVGIWRELARRQPEVYRSYLATTLSNLGAVQRDLNALDEARISLEEALGIRRELAHQRPAAFRPAIANTLNSLGVVQRDLNALEAARASLEKALEIWRDLAGQRPEIHRLDVAITLNNLGSVQYELNALEAARASYDEALGIYRELSFTRGQAYQTDIERVEKILKQLPKPESAGIKP